MADDVNEDRTPDSAPPPSAVTKKTEPGEQQEHMIPKSRFDEINTALKEAKATLEKLEGDRKAAEEAKAKERGEYERLYQEALKERETLQAQLKQRDLDLLRRQVAEESGIGPLWNRLQGEDAEALKADAEVLKTTLPKPQAPSPDGGAGRRDRGEPPDTLSPAQVKEFAARLGLREDAVKQVLGIN